MEPEGKDKRTVYQNYFLNQLHFDVLITANPEDEEQLREMQELLVDTVCKRAERSVQWAKLTRAELKEKAKTDPEAAWLLAEKRKYQSEATIKNRKKIKVEAEAGNPEAIGICAVQKISLLAAYNRERHPSADESLRPGRGSLWRT